LGYKLGGRVYAEWVQKTTSSVCRVGKIFTYKKTLSSSFERIYKATFDVRYKN